MSSPDGFSGKQLKNYERNDVNILPTCPMKRKGEIFTLLYKVRNTLGPTCNKDIVRMENTGKFHVKTLCQYLNQILAKRIGSFFK